MGPSFSTENGVRYRFYVSSALLRGRKGKAGSVGRVPAPEIEGLVEAAIRTHLKKPELNREDIPNLVERVTLRDGRVLITFIVRDGAETAATQAIGVPWERTKPQSVPPTSSSPASSVEVDAKLLQAIIRAHGWLADLTSGRFLSVEDLAEHAELHPKIIRQGLRLAFLAPQITDAICAGVQSRSVTLGNIPKLLPLRWPLQLPSEVNKTDA
jgi:site-specific DNA recombinase